MGLPTLVAVGAVSASTSAITPVLPPGTLTNDILVLPIESHSTAPDVAATIANVAGGTWTQVGFSHAGNTARLTIFWSRYNGTQTAPTTNDTGDHQQGCIIGIRGCITTGSPINVEAGAAPTFAETVSTITTITTASDNRLILAVIAGELPDADGTGVYSSWTNSGLGSLTEIVDVSTSAGLGGSLGVAIGSKVAQGVTGTTSVTHASFRVAYKQLALVGTADPPPPATGFGVDTSRTPYRATVNGVTFFPRIAYDSGELNNFSDQSVALLDLGRYRFTHYLNYQFGPLVKVLPQLTPLVPLGMYGFATGNSVTQFPMPVPPPNQNLAVVDNPSVSGTPFRTYFDTVAGAGGVYITDEPQASIIDNINLWRTTYRTDLPHQPLFYTLFPEGPLTCETSPGSGVESQFGSSVGWMEHILSVANPYWTMRNIPAGGNDWIGEDPYPNFKNETDTVNGVGAQGGFPHFWVADRTAFCVAAASLYGKVPVMTLQLFGPFQQGRFPTVPEMWTHVTMAIAEGARGLAWWQIGTNLGLRDQTEPTKTNATNALIEITAFLATNEATILSTPVTAGWSNSTTTGDALAWRKGILATMANAIIQTSFGNGGRAVYQAELNALNAGVTTWSPMLDQSGHVRMRVFQKTSSSYLVFSFNYHPAVSGTVTFTAPSTIRTVTVIGENRTLAPTGATFTDSFGGSSSANAASTQTAHIFEVTLGTSPPSVPANGPFIVKLGRY